MKKTISITVLLLLAFNSIVFSQETSEDKKYKEIFMQLMDASNLKGNFLTSTVEVLEETKNSGRIPQDKMDFFNDFINELKTISNDDLTNIFLPAYKNNFSESELKQLVKFYSSPTGKKLSEKQNQIMKDVRVNSEKFAQGIAEKLMKKYEAKMPPAKENTPITPQEPAKVEPKVETKIEAKVEPKKAQPKESSKKEVKTEKK